MPDPFCRELSLASGESLMGTASVVRRWILIEHDGPWGAVALRKNRFDPDVRSKIEELRRMTGARVLLVRRHAKQSQAGQRVMCAYTAPTRTWLEEFRFGSIDELFGLDLTPLRRGASVGGHPVSENRFFVCTHGKHDPCCAKFGRPVAAALDQAWPDRTWETSHIGGDRFAGNVLVLPLGIYYGRVKPSEAVALMDDLDRGALSLPHYRGRSAFAFGVQAAEWWARKEQSWLQLDALSLVAHRVLGPSETLTTFATRSGQAVEVRLNVAQGPARTLTCRAANTGVSPQYELRSIAVGERRDR